MKKELLFITSLFSVFCIAQVGINTPTPQKNLHVNGSLQVTNELNVGGSSAAAGNAGTSGQFLVSNGAGLAPSWQNIRSVKRVTGNSGVNIISDNIILVDAGAQSGASTVIIDFATVPFFQGYVGKTFVIKRVDDGPATVIIRGGSTSPISLFDETETQITVPGKTTIQLILESDALTGFKFQTISKT